MPRSRPTLIAVLVLWIVPGMVAGQAVRFDCGGPGYDSGGRLYLPDRPYSAANHAGHLGGERLRAQGGGEVGGTQLQPLFANARQGLDEYRFDLPSGTYLLELHFAEIAHHGPGLRRFSVLAEGVTLVRELDIFSLVEKDYAVSFRFPVNVVDDQLQVEFAASIGLPVISAIGVEPSAMDALPPAPPSGFEARGSYHRDLLLWNGDMSPDLAGYRVWRASSPGGPFTLVTADPYPLLRFLDDDATEGETWHYRVTAVDAWGNESAATPVLAATTRHDADSNLPLYRLTVAPDQLAILQADPYSDEYVDGDFEHRGVLHPGIGIRFRGNVTRHQNKKSWKVNFPGSAPFLGSDELDLNAEANDPTMLKERLAYDLLAGLNVRAPSCAFAHLQVNGEYRGVFSRVDNVDAELIERRGLASGGSLYKADSFEAGFELLDSLQAYQRAWVKQSGDEDDYSDLIALIELVNLTPDQEFLKTIVAALDVDSFLDYYATVVFTANFDHVFHNYFLYRHPVREIWELLPKDWNGTFREADFAVNYGTADHPGGPGDGNGVNVLATRLLGVPELRQRYVDKLLELLDSNFAFASVGPRVDALFAEAEPDAGVDIFKAGAERDQPFMSGPEQIRDFLSQRIPWLRREAELFAPGIAQTLFLNEVQADDPGGGADWIELFNSGSTDLDLGGHLLSDDLGEPARWTLPAGTVVPAGGRLVLWADGDTAAGADHAPFSLSAEGEAVGLFGPADQGAPLLDFIAFGPPRAGLSFGRRHDGSALWSVQDRPTPGDPNGGPGDGAPVIWAARQSPELPLPGQVVRVTAMIEDDGEIVTAALWVDAGAGWSGVPLSDDGMEDDEAAGDGLFGAEIPAAGAPAVVRYYLEAEDDRGRVVRFPRGGADDPLALAMGGAGQGLALNELMAANASTVTDEAGEYDDWIELHNPGPDAVDLSGIFLSDDLDDSRKWQVPDGTVLAAGGFLLIWADGQPEQGLLHGSFRLDADGEELALYDRIESGNGLLDVVGFPALDDDDAWGRSPDGVGEWGELAAPSPGGPNATPAPRRPCGRVGMP